MCLICNSRHNYYVKLVSVLKIIWQVVRDSSHFLKENKKSNLSFLEKCLAQNLCYLFPSTTQVKTLSFLRASPVIVRVDITSACISLFSQQHQRLRAKYNYLFTVKCVAVGIIVAIIASPIFWIAA